MVCLFTDHLSPPGHSHLSFHSPFSLTCLQLPRHPTCNQSAITLLPLKLDSLHTHLVSSLFPCYLHIVLCLDTPGEVSVLFAAVRTLLDFLPVPHVLRFDLDFVSSVLQSATLSFAVCSFVWFLSFELLAFNFPCTAFVFNKYLLV